MGQVLTHHTSCGLSSSSLSLSLSHHCVHSALQGLHTKVAQICAHVLGVPLEMVHIENTCKRRMVQKTGRLTGTRTASHGSANAGMTGGSMGTGVCSACCSGTELFTDMSGHSVQAACEELNDKLAPFRKMKPDASWKEVDWTTDVI